METRPTKHFDFTELHFYKGNHSVTEFLIASAGYVLNYPQVDERRMTVKTITQ